MKRLLVLPVLALSLAGCRDVNSPTTSGRVALRPVNGAGDMVVNETTPYTDALVGCNGERVDITGSMHFTYEITTPPGGSYHLRTTNDYTFSGVGAVTGANYQGGLRFVDKENYNAGSAIVYDVDSSVRLIGQGSVPNMWLDANTAFTINANGEISHDNVVFNVRCN
jgi:hypothetical protein